jgi:hypothetical protein
VPEVKQHIIDMSLNASGIRDTARVLHISPNTVLHELRKKEAALESVNKALLRTLHPDEIPVNIERAGEAEMDEMWSFVGKKGHQRWLWHVLLENHADARPCHWLVCEPICLWTGNIKVAISTFATLPGHETND